MNPTPPPATPFLNPGDLYDKRRSQDGARLKVYNKILDQIYHRIRLLSTIQNAPCYLLYNIPPFIIGLPKIDVMDCATYVIYQLRHAGYAVRYTPPNLLSISWQHHEQSYLTQQSPIMLAMLESAERTQAELERKEQEAARLLGPRRSQRKVRIQTPGAMAAGGSRHGGGAPPMVRPVAGPPPPSAAQYVPPPAFLQNMSHPPSGPSGSAAAAAAPPRYGSGTDSFYR